jgi:hypothetical protein
VSQSPVSSRQPPASDAEVVGGSPLERTDAAEDLEPDQELLTVNFGPHHPATDGVLRVVVSLEGEVVGAL